MKRILKKRALCLVLIAALLFSFSVNAFASDGADRKLCIVSEIKKALVKYVQNHKNFLTKAIVRAEFRTVATAGAAIGLTTAGTLLNHSLKNNPKDFVYGSNSQYGRQFAKSEEFREIIDQFLNGAGEKEEHTMSGTTALNSSIDLYLAYNSVSYTATGKKTDNAWTISVTFTDTYDFDMLAWKDNLSDSPAVIALNNYAAYAQKLGAIVPFHVEITGETTIAVEN